MVTFLNGNYLLWGLGVDTFRTTFDGGNKIFHYSPSYYEAFTGAPPIPEPGYPLILTTMTQMKFAGTFVGMIFLIELNEYDDLPGNDVTFEFVKTTNNGLTIVNTGVKCIVPGSKTGLFFSNIDISEFTRTWDSFEWITVKRTIDPGAPDFPGTGPGTLMMVLDLDIP